MNPVYEKTAFSDKIEDIISNVSDNDVPSDIVGKIAGAFNSHANDNTKGEMGKSLSAILACLKRNLPKGKAEDICEYINSMGTAKNDEPCRSILEGLQR